MSELEVIETIDSHGISLASQFSFTQLANEASARIIDQPQLEKKKHTLQGVPHIITRASFRIPTIGADGKLQRGFVSLEARIADLVTLERAIRKGWIPEVPTMAQLPFEPEESTVYNDGSTGIRRQVVMILQSMGLVDIGDLTGDNSDFDRPWTEWRSFKQEGKERDKKTNELITVPDFTRGEDKDTPLIIMAKHGLRVSPYDYYGQPAETFYLS